MSIRNTTKEDLKIQRTVRGTIQTGTIPAGVTAVDAGYPVNISDVILGDPTTVPVQYPLYPIEEIYPDYTLKITDNWENKIKSGDALEIKRGNIKGFYTVQKNSYDPVTNLNTITLFSARENNLSLDSFIGATGYPVAAPDTFLLINKEMENPNDRKDLVKSFDYKMIPSDTDTFSLLVSWSLDPNVSATRLRWRTTPRVSLDSNLSFTISTIGYYSQVPTVNLISSTGRSANVALKSSIHTVYLASGGTGYSSASITVSGGGGTGASLVPNITSGAVSSVTIVSGGTGYTSLPTVTISGDGTGASVSYLKLAINTISVLDQGGGYLSAPSIEVDSTYLLTTPVGVTCSLSLVNSGSVDYVKILQGGSGYTGASVSITGSSTLQNATAVAYVENGSIVNVKVLNGGKGYTGASVSVTPSGPSGAGAVLSANIDLFSDWFYEDILYKEKTKTITGLKTNLPYEIQIIASEDELFRGLVKYSDSYTFQYVK
jgi:hypothetical protein